MGSIWGRFWEDSRFWEGLGEALGGLDQILLTEMEGYLAQVLGLHLFLRLSKAKSEVPLYISRGIASSNILKHP